MAKPIPKKCLACNDTFFFRCFCGKQQIEPDEARRLSLEVQDVVVEMSKDLLMHNFVPLLHEMDDHASKQQESPKVAAFHRLIIALHAARAEAESFHAAHMSEQRNDLRSQMEKDLAEEFKRVDSLVPGTAS